MVTSSTTPVSLVRIGLIGLGQTGLHHLEQLSLRSDLHVVTSTGYAGDQRAIAIAAQFCDDVSPGVDELLQRDDVDFVIVSGPLADRPELVIRALRRGKNVAVESPPCRSAAQLDEMLAAARDRRGRLCLLPSRQDDLDFRAALETVRGGALGKIQSARLLSWGRALPGVTEFGQHGPSRIDESDDAFAFFAFSYLDQLFQLVRRPPRSVFARILSNGGTPPDGDGAPAIAFVLAIGLRDGGDAIVDVNLRSAAALQTGWVLAGRNGGYRGQRIYVADPSGEICDAPVAVPEAAEIDPYAPLLDRASNDDGCSQSACRAQTILRTIDAARESSRLNQPIDLPEPVGELRP